MVGQRLTIFVWLLCGAMAFGADSSGSPTPRNRSRPFKEPSLKLGTVPVVKLEREIVASPNEVAEIKQHIDHLAKIDRPDFGFSSTMSATTFTPLKGSEKMEGGFILTNHRIQTTEDVRALVQFGSRALPFLLAALDDKTPTKLVIDDKSSIVTVMYFSNELWGNPANTTEKAAVDVLPKRDWNGETMSSYTVKVGDVCFAIIGQIVGRNYQAVRYQPTAIVIINSPVQDRALAKQVRSIWSGANPAQHLLDSLLIDYSTEGISDGNSLDKSYSVASEFQTGAAMRLLYYFPREAGDLVAKRLAQLDVRATGEGITNYVQREVSNGVRTKDFIKAVSWSGVPSVRHEVVKIFKKTTDVELLLAALPGVDLDETNSIYMRLNAFLETLPSDENGPFGQGYDLLVSLGMKLGDNAKSTFTRYLKDGSLQRWRTMSQVLRKTQSQWAVELLFPALSDKREFGWEYALVPGKNEPRRPIRVCDEAAETISLSRSDLKFQMAGEHENLDRQIAVMRQRISDGKP